MSDNDMTPEEWLAHYGVKGMKWGVRRSPEERVARAQAKKETRDAVRKVGSKPITNNDADIQKARKQLPTAERRYASARDQYKVDKQVMDKIAAKRPMKVAAAELSRISQQADRLTKEEKAIYDTLQIGRAIGDAFLRNEPRGTFQKSVDRDRDRQAARKAASRG